MRRPLKTLAAIFEDLQIRAVDRDAVVQTFRRMIDDLLSKPLATWPTR